MAALILVWIAGAVALVSNRQAGSDSDSNGAGPVVTRERHVASGEAYQLYVKGREHYARSTPQDYQRSLEYFRQAVQKDPSYAQAHAGMARVLSAMTYEGLLPPSTYREVETAASTALALDDTLGDAHLALAQFNLAYLWKWEEAEREFQRALALSSRDATIYRYYSLFMRIQRRWDEAIALMERAFALDQFSAEISKALGATYLWAGRHDLAIEQFRKTREMDPTHAQTHDLLADAFVAKGEYASALESRRTQFRHEGMLDEADALGQDGSEHGYRTAMRGVHARYLGILEETARTEYVSPIEFALVYVALGDTERAFAMLDKAFGERAPWLTSLAADPAFDPIRSDHRFTELLAKVGIPYRR